MTDACSLRFSSTCRKGPFKDIYLITSTGISRSGQKARAGLPWARGWKPPDNGSEGFLPRLHMSEVLSHQCSSQILATSSLLHCMEVKLILKCHCQKLSPDHFCKKKKRGPCADHSSGPQNSLSSFLSMQQLAQGMCLYMYIGEHGDTVTIGKSQTMGWASR